MANRPFFGHLDADAFYVSAERVRDAFLRGKPVGILGNQGACVIAKSYEMKAAGVKTGTPIWEATRLCPRGVYLKRDFRWYEVVSRRMLEVVREFSPAVEYYSIDEFFFRAMPHNGLSLQETAEAMRDRMIAALELPVTVGIARTKTLAKLVTDTAKPFGAVALEDHDAEWALLEQTPVTAVSGIALRRAERLAAYGIHNCLDFAFADRKLIRALITLTGEALWWELNGDPVLPLYTQRPPHKILSRGGSVGVASDDLVRIRGWLARHLERLVEELEFHNVWAGALSVHVAHKDGPDGVARALLSSPTQRFDQLLEAAYWCLDRARRPDLLVSRLQLTATQLQRPGFIQKSLFDEQEDETLDTVRKVQREINEALGRFTVRSGATLPLADAYRDKALEYDICDVHGKMCF